MLRVALRTEDETGDILRVALKLHFEAQMSVRATPKTRGSKHLFGSTKYIAQYADQSDNDKKAVFRGHPLRILKKLPRPLHMSG